jgi:hypothetical protein
MLFLITAFAVVVIVAFVSYSFGVNAGSNSKTSATTSVNARNLSVLTTTPPPSSISYAYPTPINVSDYHGFITPTEANSLLGPSNHTAYAATNSSQLNTTLSGLMPNNIGYTITSEHIISYDSHATVNVSGVRESTGILQELLLESNSPQKVYAEGLNLYSDVFNLTSLRSNANLSDVNAQTNITLYNMTYSYSSYDAAQYGTNTMTNYIRILGFKGNTTAFVSMAQPLGSSSNAIEVASAVASHI